MIYNIKTFFKKGKEDGGKFYAALYELTDKELIKHLTDANDIEIILSNANNSKIKLWRERKNKNQFLTEQMSKQEVL